MSQTHSTAYLPRRTTPRERRAASRALSAALAAGPRFLDTVEATCPHGAVLDREGWTPCQTCNPIRVAGRVEL